MLYLPPCGILSLFERDVYCWICLVLSLSLPILNCEERKMLSCPVLQVTLDCTHHHPHPPLPSVHLFPGSQIYHSAVCVLVQFLMLRLMGRTVTTVLSSFIFQMVRFPCASFVCTLTISMRPGLRYSISSPLSTIRLLLQWLRSAV